jgi:hypothetical protein
MVVMGKGFELVGGRRGIGGRGFGGTFASRSVGNLLANQEILEALIARFLAVLVDSDGELLQIALKDLALVDNLLGGGGAVLLESRLSLEEDVPDEKQDN